MKALKRMVMSFALAALAIGHSGCGDSVDAELQSARSAIEAAKNLGADKTALAGLWEATNYLDSALVEIDRQKKDFLRRDYANARRLLELAGIKAREAGATASQAAGSKAAPGEGASAPVVASAPAVAADTVATDTVAAGQVPTRDASEAAINSTYAAYQRARRKSGKDEAFRARLEIALKDLLAAKSAMAKADYVQAMNLARSAGGMLETIPK